MIILSRFRTTIALMHAIVPIKKIVFDSNHVLNKIDKADETIKAKSDAFIRFVACFNEEILLDISFFPEDNENNYRELEQILIVFWTTFKSINNLIEEMKSSTSSIQRLLQKYDSIHFDDY